MSKEIEKLCADILPETLRTYVESKGWVLSHKIDAWDVYFRNNYEQAAFIPWDDDTLSELSEAEDRPILAILFDLWKIQNPDENDLTWLSEYLNLCGIKIKTKGRYFWGLDAIEGAWIDRDKRIAELEAENKRIESLREGEAALRVDNLKKNCELEVKVEELKKKSLVIGFSSGFQKTLEVDENGKEINDA